MIGHWIDGQERASRSGETFESVDPWSQRPYAEVALAGRADIADAVAAASRATREWTALGTEGRGRLLHRLAELIVEHDAELAAAETHDVGKTVTDALTRDVPRTAANFRFFADHVRLTTSETYPMDSGHHAYTRYEPAGVVAAVAPWNFPLMLASWKVAPALAWGNTVVLKPAEDSPASATVLARLATEAGLPDGVLNVVHGYGPDSAGEFLVTSAGIDRVTFTGESATGRVIAAAAAQRLVPVSLELGGKAANVVFDDCNLEDAVEWVARSAFFNAGQVCLAGSRCVVQRGVYDEFIDRLAAAADGLRVGDPNDPATEVGPLSSKGHFVKVAGYLASLGSGRAVKGGGAATDGSWVVEPTVVADATPEDRVWQEEVFGPLTAVVPFRTEDEAVALANDTRYGLNAMVFTESLRRAHRVAASLHAGTVWVNCFNVRDLRAPFGGVGDSGVGREGGLFSRDFFTEPKAVFVAP